MTTTIPNDTASCAVLGWCQQPPEHDGNHVRLVGLVEPSPSTSTVLVTIEAGPGETEPLPVLTLAGLTERGRVIRLSARMTWREAGELGGLIDVAALAVDRDPINAGERRLYLVK